MSLDEKSISKLKNIYIMLLDAIMKENVDTVDHFLDDGLTKTYRRIIENNKNKNVTQHYDLLNISNVQLVRETSDEITITATTKYISYKTDKNTNVVVSGDSNNRVANNTTLVFKRNPKQDRLVYKCPGCGSNLDINASGICQHCGKAVDERYSEYVLKSVY